LAVTIAFPFLDFQYLQPAEPLEQISVMDLQLSDRFKFWPANGD
jgi:hypothetical protein